MNASLPVNDNEQSRPYETGRHLNQIHLVHIYGLYLVSKLLSNKRACDDKDLNTHIDIHVIDSIRFSRDYRSPHQASNHFKETSSL